MIVMNQVLLYGPAIDLDEHTSVYGGGTGGYTRNMRVYLEHGDFGEYEIRPCFHTVRGQIKLDYFFVRFIVDTLRFLRCVLRARPAVVHVLAQYRFATPREFMIVAISRLFRIPVLYEIKAGALINWYNAAGRVSQWLLRKIVEWATVVLVEGVPYIEFLRDNFGVESHYFPNFVPTVELPDTVPVRLQSPAIRVVFVGYAYRGKGVYELVEGCNLAAQEVEIELTLIGHEEEELAGWLDEYTPHENFSLVRAGRLPHHEILERLAAQDVFGFPTSHSGEGHSNAINEAMMSGLVIMATRHGFLDTIVGETRGYMLEAASPESIATALLAIHHDRPEARRRAANATEHLRTAFTSDAALAKLEGYYRQCIGPTR